MVPTDAASILAEAARHYGLPARLVEGYRLAPGEHTHAMAHRNAWCEVLIDGLGWIGFDAMDKSCPSEDSVRVAIGLDAPSVAAVRAAPLWRGTCLQARNRHCAFTGSAANAAMRTALTSGDIGL